LLCKGHSFWTPFSLLSLQSSDKYSFTTIAVTTERLLGAWTTEQAMSYHFSLNAWGSISSCSKDRCSQSQKKWWGQKN